MNRGSLLKKGLIVRHGKYEIDHILNVWNRKRLDGKAIRHTRKKIKVFKKYGTNCVYCGLRGSFFAVEWNKKAYKRPTWHLNLYADVPGGGTRLMTMDHVKPKSAGGKDSLSNLRPACSKCNERKSNIPLLEWLKKNKERAKYPVRITNWNKVFSLSWMIRCTRFLFFKRKLPYLPTKTKWVEAEICTEMAKAV